MMDLCFLSGIFLTRRKNQKHTGALLVFLHWQELLIYEYFGSIYLTLSFNADKVDTILK